MEQNLTYCPGCGAAFEAEDGPVHPYMTASPACWRRYGLILAAEYSDEALQPVNRFGVDSYAVQHPGDDSRRAIQSVGLHLARLMIQLEAPLTPSKTNEVMLAMATRKASLAYLEPPANFSMTVADIFPHAGTEKHADLVRDWAYATWQDWKEHHVYIRNWVEC